MSSHSLYGWFLSGGRYRRVRLQIPPGPSGNAVSGETPFDVEAAADPYHSFRYDYANDLTYAQTADRDERPLQVYEVSPAPSHTRPGRVLRSDGATFSAVAFSPSADGSASLFAADPAGSRLYRLGPPTGAGAQASRNGTWTGFHDLAGRDVWAQHSIADLAIDVLEGHGNEPVPTAFVLSGPTFREQGETYLLIQRLQEDEGPGPDVLKVPADVRKVGVDPDQSYAWLSGPDSRLCRVYLDGSGRVEPLDFTCAGPAVFVRAGDTVWVVFMDSNTSVRCVDVAGKAAPFRISAPDGGSVGSPLIGTGGAGRVWTLPGTDHGPSLYEWDIAQGRCTDLGVLNLPEDFVLVPDLDYR